MTSNVFGGRKAITQMVYSVHVQIYVYLLGRVPMDSVSLTKILCHRNFGNEFVFTHSKDYLYYILSSLTFVTVIFDNETSPQN